MSGASTGYESHSPHERKFSAVEMGPGGQVVELTDMNSEDQTLAQFGYKPVIIPPSLRFHLPIRGHASLFLFRGR